MSPLRGAPAELRGADARLRSRYLAEVLPLLYPATGADDESGPRAQFVVVPSARQPRLLVPAGSRRLAASAVRRYALPRSRIARLKRDAVVAALRTGAGGLLLRDRVSVATGADTIESYLRRALGTEVSVSLHIGPARANRKPILQLLAPDGSTVGFAKIGSTPLTRRLVEAETAALRQLATVDLTTVQVPRIVHHGEWHGHAVMVQSALPVWQRRVVPAPHRLASAMLEVASCVGVTQAPLGASGYWSTLDARLATIGDRPEGAAVATAARVLVANAGDHVLRYGCWHGDWAPWNMASLDGTVLLWDWERFATGVPLGFDALHHRLQLALQAGRFQGSVDATAAVGACLDSASRLLRLFDVAPPAAEVTALLYLIDLAARYLADRQAEAGARLGVLGTWLLPVLLRRISVHATQPRK